MDSPPGDAVPVDAVPVDACGVDASVLYTPGPGTPELGTPELGTPGLGASALGTPGLGASALAASGVCTELVRLLQCHAVEVVRLDRTFASAHDLHPTDWAALLALMRGERVGMPLTPGELGERLGISSGATTAVVDRLERAGHVRRVRDERDRRRLALHRAESAQTLLTAFFEPLEAAMAALAVGYTAAELAAVQRFLAEAVGQVGEHRRRLAQR